MKISATQAASSQHSLRSGLGQYLLGWRSHIEQWLHRQEVETRLASPLLRLAGFGPPLRRNISAHIQRKLTEMALARLDRSILEDIGVPHDRVSPAAGALERYERVIIPRL